MIRSKISLTKYGNQLKYFKKSRNSFTIDVPFTYKHITYEEMKDLSYDWTMGYQ